jgi:DNA-binding MarR family transcriptional regulator
MADSINAVSRWLERLSALHRNLMRRFAAEEGLQLVHVEILQYLSICNRYSDTNQSLSEYLGQTKGSISQSLSYLEENGFVRRARDKSDKRIFHLALTAKGQSVARRLADHLDVESVSDLEVEFKTVLSSIQRQNGLRGFGICRTCKHNQNPGKDSFVCGLTQERLTIEDVKKICREHEASA